MANDSSLIDTNVLIYATLEDDPRHPAARAALLEHNDNLGQMYVSVQCLGEMYPNLTGPKMTVPDSPALARAKIESIAALPRLSVLPLTADIQRSALELCEKHGVRRQRSLDMQLVATMIHYDISVLITENEKDFSGISEVRVSNPFRD